MLCVYKSNEIKKLLISEYKCLSVSKERNCSKTNNCFYIISYSQQMK